eukprot:11702731-Ditylum_brightwellii.AAC.1
MLVSNTAAMKKLAFITGCLIHCMDGVMFDKTHDLSQLPCTLGIRSRWMLVHNTDCNLTVLAAVNIDTRAAFESLLHYSVDDNPYMCDVVLYEDNHYDGQMYNANNINKTDFVVLLGEEG